MDDASNNPGIVFCFGCAQGAQYAKILGCDFFREGLGVETMAYYSSGSIRVPLLR